jgi:hypothetical protein
MQRRGGRTRIVAPDGSEIAPSSKSQPDGSAIVSSSKPQPDATLVKARAWSWQKQLENGCYGTMRELAQAEGINHAYVVRLLKLTLLAPDLVEAIVDGQQQQRTTMQEMLREVPVVWEEQRRKLTGQASPTCN